MLRKTVTILIVIGLLLTAYLGISNGLNDLQHSHTTAQKFVSYNVVIYGVFALIAVAGILLRKRWAFVAILIWGILCTSAAFLATVIWGNTGVGSGLAAAGGAALVVILPIIYVRRTAA